MYEKPDTPQQWSVHAEVTISHNPPNDGTAGSATNPPGTAHTEQSGNGLRMVYTWTNHPPTSGNEPTDYTTPRPSTTLPSDTASRSSAQSGHSGQSYGFQRGGMTFTSVPPRHQTTTFEPTRLGVQDSGYNSELLSPSSYAPSSVPRRPPIPYNRRCRSTCSIILSTAFNADGHNVTCDTSATAQPITYHHCGRTQSLRCQTPSIKPERRDSYYGCGDPWCYHAEDFANRRCSPVLESCEECSVSNQSVSNQSVSNQSVGNQSSKRASRANTFTTHFCTRVPERNRSSPPSFAGDYRSKDMASQTVETQEKCTSPFEKMDPPFSSEKKEESKRKSGRKTSDRRKSNVSSRRNSDNNVLSPPTAAEDAADNRKSSKRITRSPAVLRGRSPMVERRSPDQEASKKQRTVHIDVYCTGSDVDSEDSSSNSEEDSQSTPQTVYESEKMRIAHRRAGSSEIPYSLRTFLDNNDKSGTIQDEQRKLLAEKLTKHNSDSDEDTSTAYPSAMSSYSAIRDFESSMSSVPPSWSALSTSSCTVPDAYDSFATTSCKDTVSDFESLVMRKFSLAPDESEYFIPRRLQSDDTTSDIAGRSSIGSLLPSDSFEYADSTDRDRIKDMEQLWDGNPEQKTWKSPSAERKFLLQQQKMKEYLEKRIQEKSESKSPHKDTESESTEDESEQGWSFVRSPDENKANLKRDITVRRASRDAVEDPDSKTGAELVKEPPKEPLKKSLEKNKLDFGEAAPERRTPQEVTVRPTSEPVKTSKDQPQRPIEGGKTPVHLIQSSSSCTAIGPQRYDTNFRAPFTIVPGKYTDQLYTAQKFGTVIGLVRKPGHHIGPAKNPDCLCDHCRRYFEDMQARSRTRSMGDNPMGMPVNWREMLKPRPSPTKKPAVSDF